MPTADQDSKSLRLAAIDVGSNSVHMIVAQIDADGVGHDQPSTR